MFGSRREAMIPFYFEVYRALCPLRELQLTQSVSDAVTLAVH